MDTYSSEEMTTLKELLSKAGGWPLLAGSGWQTGQGANFTWWGMEAKAKELGITLGMLGRSSLLTLSQYSKDGIFPPKLSIFHSERYGRGAWQKLLLPNDTSVSAYETQMVEVAVLLGADRAVAEKDIKEAVEFTIQLAKAMFATQGKGKTMTIQSLADMVSNVPVASFFPNKT